MVRTIYQDSTIETLVKSGFAVRTLDHQSFGRSQGQDGIQCSVPNQTSGAYFKKFDHLVDEAEYYITEIVMKEEILKGMPIFLFGISMGGATAIKLAHRAPERCVQAGAASAKMRWSCPATDANDRRHRAAGRSGRARQQSSPTSGRKERESARKTTPMSGRKERAGECANKLPLLRERSGREERASGHTLSFSCDLFLSSRANNLFLLQSLSRLACEQPPSLAIA